MSIFGRDLILNIDDTGGAFLRGGGLGQGVVVAGKVDQTNVGYVAIPADKLFHYNWHDYRLGDGVDILPEVESPQSVTYSLGFPKVRFLNL